jgi:hypothetical protein
MNEPSGLLWGGGYGFGFRGLGGLCGLFRGFTLISRERAGGDGDGATGGS